MPKTESRKNREKCPTLKYGWPSQNEAMIALWRRSSSSRAHDKPTNEKRTYHCPLCGRWHWTSQPKGRRE